MLVEVDSRSPSWGAWIEMFLRLGRMSPACGRSPSWGAWIEISLRKIFSIALRPSLPLVGSVD